MSRQQPQEQQHRRPQVVQHPWRHTRYQHTSKYAPWWQELALQQYPMEEHETDDSSTDEDAPGQSCDDKKRKRKSDDAVTIHSQHMSKRHQQQQQLQQPLARNPFPMRRMEKAEINEAVKDSVFAFFNSIHNVPADGNCGYYVLFDFLRENTLLPSSCRTVTDLRRLIYDFSIEHKDELLSDGSFFMENGYWRVFKDPSGERSEQVFHQDMSKVYNKDEDFEGGCAAKYWMNANMVLPLVAMAFNINVWLLSADGDPFTDPDTGKKLNDQPYTTMFTVKTSKDGKREVQREIIRGSVAFPVHSLKDGSSDKKTAFLIHVDGNHYVSAKK
ncbi:MAG: hypothetical protein SGILL_009794 [Bacillariaceae sp.]